MLTGAGVVKICARDDEDVSSAVVMLLDASKVFIKCIESFVSSQAASAIISLSASFMSLGIETKRLDDRTIRQRDIKVSKVVGEVLKLSPLCREIISELCRIIDVHIHSKFSRAIAWQQQL